MKTLVLAAVAAFAFGTSAALAGGAAPATPAEVVIADTGNSNDGILVPIMAVILFGLALASD